MCRCYFINLRYIYHCFRWLNLTYFSACFAPMFTKSCLQWLLLLLWTSSIFSAANTTSVPYDVTSRNETHIHRTQQQRGMNVDPDSSTIALRNPPTQDEVCACQKRSAHRNELVKIGVILPLSETFLWSLKLVHPAIALAVDEVNNDSSLLSEHTVTINARDSQCSETVGPLAAIDMYYKKSADVFLGPACGYSVAPVARFSKYWGIPVLSAGALVAAFKDKTEYRLLTRMQGTHAKLGQFVLSLLKLFSWSHAGLLYDDATRSPNVEKRRCYFTAEAIFHALFSHFGRRPYNKRFDERSPTEDYASLLRNLSTQARGWCLGFLACVVNWCLPLVSLCLVSPTCSQRSMERPWYRADDTAERNAKARRAYESLMTVTLRKPTGPQYRKFSNSVKERAARMYNYTYEEPEVSLFVNSFVGAFYDAVILYALALNETLEAGGSVKDGLNITNRMWNRTFSGITGTVSIDSNGDRNADYSLLDLNPESDTFQVVGNLKPWRVVMCGVTGVHIHWPGGRTGPPPDVPQCGFDGSKCPEKKPLIEYGIVTIVLLSILVVVLLITFILYRRYKQEAELAAMNWRVRWDDILFSGPTRQDRPNDKRGGQVRLFFKMSYRSECSEDTIAVHLNDIGNRQLFTKTGYYKGAILAVKPISRTHISITKPLLMEIKRMKDLQNDHLVRFHGVCIDVPNQSILTEYCPKGSLQDVLENDKIKLDWMFRYSIMQDIVRGMTYIHSSEIKSHGHLKSSNCVVDSRFVVKITDFGLHYFKEKEEQLLDDIYAWERNKLWTAPELLRLMSPPPGGTQKGDVYSFAIICQEIVYRSGVFYLQGLDLSPVEIVDKLRHGGKPPFRPTIEEFDCPSDELAGVIRRCWAEDPSDRPDFQALRTIIRRLNKDGDKGDILDNLLSRMEQYANNLEALVEERTADYLQEKKKAEELLYNMLPKSVAHQLIRGETVAAEWFDHVTIYFSDICGFTALSAESTPMQIVDLLNDLYTVFDSIVEHFDVYKVETIGDAYMVVSGLPVKNGNLHAREIARMSLALLDAVFKFKIRHRPADQLKLRIGIHSGPVCAGVVGLKMPRYCLFGDTVNTSSRMESNGLPLRIHVSPYTRDILQEHGTFHLEKRGPVEMKGKGTVTTYW
ncbi:hypothetical protein EGW08_011027, partial [Elysia chlorotica]